MLKFFDRTAMNSMRMLDRLVEASMDFSDLVDSRSTLFKGITAYSLAWRVVYPFTRLWEWVLMIVAIILWKYLELRGLHIEWFKDECPVPEGEFTTSLKARRRPSPPNNNWLKEGF